MLTNISEDFSRRMALRRKMMAHFGIHLTEDHAPHLKDDVRESVLACGACRCPELCEFWMAKGREGAPDGCRARYALMRLEALTRDAPLARSV